MTEHRIKIARVIEWQLNERDDALRLKGTITLSSGTATVQLVSRTTGNIFYSNDFTNSNGGSVTIDIPNLEGDRSLNLVITGKNARNFVMSMCSEQKLVLDPPTPAIPAVTPPPAPLRP